MTAYYNEIDHHAAQWLRNLIEAGHIAPGVVDERSIEDVRPNELTGYTQCHFFAGIGIWSHALRAAGVPDDTPLWTGSCPCQPFSAAGQGEGFDDERHLWPAFFHLIRECRPASVLGEQVASKDAEPWIDLVCDDLGSLGYATGAIAFPSAGVGAPHIRDRLYWVADADGARSLPRAHAGVHRGEEGTGPRDGEPERHGSTRGLGNTIGAGLAQRQRFPGVPGGPCGADQGQAVERAGVHAGGLGDANRAGQQARQRITVRDEPRPGKPAHSSPHSRPGPTNGFWRAADWLGCTDGKWRPVEPGTFPLAHGAAARVGRLRAYGNAINAEAARVFIECVMEAA